MIYSLKKHTAPPFFNTKQIMYSIEHARKDNPPKLTKFLKKRVLCGHCSFKCCNSPSFDVETTEEESKRLGLPRRFPQEGKCRCLKKNGCKFGDGRPVYCKLFPLQVTKDNKLVISHWSILHCPISSDYKLEDEAKEASGTKRVYTKKKAKSKPKNANLEIELHNKKLKDLPTVVEVCKDAIIELWGEAYYKDALEYATQEEPKGFGFIHNDE